MTLTLYTIRKKERNFFFFLRYGFQIVILGFLLLSCWSVNAIKPLAFIVLIRIYYWIFKVNRIYDTDIDKLPTLFFQFVISILLLVVHVIFIGKILLKNKSRASAIFYIVNGNLLFFGMVEKQIGIKEAFKKINQLIATMVLIGVGLVWLGCLINEFQKYE